MSDFKKCRTECAKKRLGGVSSLSWYKRIAFATFIGWLLSMSHGGVALGESGKVEQSQLRISVVFNNVPFKAGLKSGWGFSSLIEGMDKTVLFDTGGNGDILLSNMEKLGLDPENIDAVVLSHIHGDHTGGLDALLACNPNLTVYMPESFPAAFQQKVKRFGTRIELVSGPRQLLDGVYTTGEMGLALKEQALIVETRKGLLLITGCAHPEIVRVAERAETYRGKSIYLLMGGFHLGGRSETEIREIIERLKALNVKKVVPSHCTGDGSIQMFRHEWADGFVEGGLGAVIEAP
jgi:7,8-dihydropterin-6-yl-methyl-4-(beta-D-ribofuranosyl)aminobenzene 5'-phosphate synthase